jgi:chromate reductase, NAD(P)H dehydrogenase (quinone)
VRVLGISGSLRRESHNTRLLRAAAELLPPPVEFELFEGLKGVPPYDEDDDGDLAPFGVRRLREAIAAADAVLIATPEYNSSIPGQLKNALDWASRPFPDNVLRNKPVAVARKVLSATGARVVDAELPVAGAERAFSGTRLADNDAHAGLAQILDDLVAEVAERQLAA